MTNEDTNVTSEAVTQPDGAYRAPFLIPGKYRVDVVLEAFKKFSQSGITVGVTQNVTVDAKLINDANFGRIPTPRGSVYFPRNVQLGLKYYF